MAARTPTRIAVTFGAMFWLSSVESSPLMSLVSAVVGGWIAALPWGVFGYDGWAAGSVPAWNETIVGVTITILALASFTGGIRLHGRKPAPR